MPKFAMYLIDGRVAALSIFALLFCAECSAGDWSRVVVDTQLSPSGKIRAELVESNGGASTSYAYDLYLSSTNLKNDAEKIHVLSAYATSRSDVAYGMNVRWIGENSLEVHYYKTRSIRMFQDVVNVGGEQITVHVVSGVIDALAPEGAMERH